PEQDWKDIQILINALERTSIKRFVLVSTVDVYPTPINVNEDSEIDKEKLHAYGLNRLRLEEWVKIHYKDYLIIRLPGLFGQNIMKNFIHDILFPIPALFNENFYSDLKNTMNEHDFQIIERNYPKVGVNYTWNHKDEANVKNVLNQYKISSLMFTDSQDIFQFYDLSQLKTHIELCFENNIKIINLVSEPLSAFELYSFLFNRIFDNSLPRVKQFYDLRTKHASVFGGQKGYISTKQKMFIRIKRFIEAYKK
ncbi:MAG: NAD(P)-dependent oxidoreductase, partial [Ignavibacteria bacterium]|nr:NAD(P)-dependent oxidoreductase [Ignavibacteria bacterium]